MVTIKLVKSIVRGDHDSIRQRWIITDGKREIKVISETDDGSITIEKGGKELVNIAGTPINTGQIVGVAISVALGPCDDGEEYVLDATWLKRVKDDGFNVEYLCEPIDDYVEKSVVKNVRFVVFYDDADAGHAYDRFLISAKDELQAAAKSIDKHGAYVDISPEEAAGYNDAIFVERLVHKDPFMHETPSENAKEFTLVEALKARKMEGGE